MRRSDLQSWLDGVRGAEVLGGPARVLAGHFADAMPDRGSVLLVGAGGQLFRALSRLRPDLRIARFDADGDTSMLPFETGGADYVGLVDVYHDTDQMAALLGEAVRVARRTVVLKDRQREGLLAGPTLRALARLTGRHRPAAYLDRREWQRVFFRAGLTTLSSIERLRCLPAPLGWILERRLHFVASLTRRYPHQPEG